MYLNFTIMVHVDRVFRYMINFNGVKLSLPVARKIHSIYIVG